MTPRFEMFTYFLENSFIEGQTQVREPGSAGGGSAPWRISTRTSRPSGESSRRLTSSLRPGMEMEKRGEFYWKLNLIAKLDANAEIYVVFIVIKVWAIMKPNNQFNFWETNMAICNEQESIQPLLFCWALYSWTQDFKLELDRIMGKKTCSGCLYDSLFLINT